MSRRSKVLRGGNGFTLAELLIVVAIIAVLVAIAIPIFNNRLEASREAADVATLRQAWSGLVACENAGEFDDGVKMRYTEVSAASWYGYYNIQTGQWVSSATFGTLSTEQKKQFYYKPKAKQEGWQGATPDWQVKFYHGGSGGVYTGIVSKTNWYNVTGNENCIMTLCGSKGKPSGLYIGYDNRITPPNSN